jgi:hypothetical protein
MGQPTEGRRQAPHTLAPIQLEVAIDRREISKMRDRSGFRSALMLAAGVAVTMGVAALITSLDSRQAYATAAAQLERSDTDQRDAFMRCALPHYQRVQLVWPNALRAEVERVTQRMEKSYALVLVSCAPLLANFRQAVENVQAPSSVKPSLEWAAQAARDFETAWLELKTSLARPGAAYDQAQVAPLIEQITATWKRYLAARDRAKRALSDHL